MINGGVPIARIWGIEVRVSLAWTLLIALITVIGAQQATIGSPDLNPIVQWVIGVAVALLFFVSVIGHELAHAVVGRRRGVPATSIVLGFIGGLAPLGIQAARARDELGDRARGPAGLARDRRRAAAGRDRSSGRSCRPPRRCRAAWSWSAC